MRLAHCTQMRTHRKTWEQIDNLQKKKKVTSDFNNYSMSNEDKSGWKIKSYCFGFSRTFYASNNFHVANDNVVHEMFECTIILRADHFYGVKEAVILALQWYRLRHFFSFSVHGFSEWYLNNVWIFFTIFRFHKKKKKMETSVWS